MLNISTSGHSRFQDKIDRVTWFIMAILPVFVFFVMNYRQETNTDFITFVSTFSPFPFITDILNSVTSTAFGVEFSLNAYLGYLVGIEILHVLFDIIVFIPRFAHKIMSKAINFGD